VFDMRGTCLAFGDQRDMIWRNLMNMKDVKGKSIIGQFIQTAGRGAGEVTYQVPGATVTAYVEPVTKDGIPYVIGSRVYKH